jgi:hypothetical protein
MKWLVRLWLIGGLSMGIASARADWGVANNAGTGQYVPTTPQVPAPRAEGNQVPLPQPQPLQQYQPQPGQQAPQYQQRGVGPGNCQTCAPADTRTCLQKIKAWYCYKATAGDALPKLAVHPYIPPYMGNYYCSCAPLGPSIPNNFPLPAWRQDCGKGKSCTATTGNAPIPNAAPAPLPPMDSGNDNGKLGPTISSAQSMQGFPSRGCQGWSMPLSDPTFPGSSHGNPAPTGTIATPEAGPVVEVPVFRTAGTAGKSN